ncbi:MAG: hypothetical protein ABIZ80_10545 [Bryobacteraceae bacterium]
MELDKQLESQALQEALGRYPQFASAGTTLVARPVYNGVTFMVDFADANARTDPDAWEFQNAVVKGYKRLAGL